MRRLWGALLAAAAPAACLVTASGAAVLAPSGDTCTASGSGSSYTLSITIPGNAPAQAGFAFGAPGATVTNINIPGTVGTLSTQSLPANTTGEWLLSAPVQPGSITANLATSGHVTGPFTVVADGSPSSSSFAPFLCTVAAGAPMASNAFSAAQHPSYDAATGSWHELVTVPGAGVLSAVQLIAANQVAMPKALIQGDKANVKSAGRFDLNLKLTGEGKKTLASHKSIKLKLSVTFLPTNGKAANRVLALTLSK